MLSPQGYIKKIKKTIMVFITYINGKVVKNKFKKKIINNDSGVCTLSDKVVNLK